MIGRRGFITGLISLVAAPAIVRVGSLMPIRGMVLRPPNAIDPWLVDWVQADPCLIDADGGFIMPVPSWVIRDLLERPDLNATQIFEMVHRP
jgi:hypothetical protein